MNVNYTCTHTPARNYLQSTQNTHIAAPATSRSTSHYTHTQGLLKSIMIMDSN